MLVQHEVRTVLVLSTEHMPAEVSDQMSKITEQYSVSDLPWPFMYETAWGFGVYARGSVPNAAEWSWLLPVLHLAKQLDVDELRFDADGPVYDELPTYDWK